METTYHVLFAGEIRPDTSSFGDPVSHQGGLPVHFSTITTYGSAIQAIQEHRVDAVFVSEAFDGHSGLEFIHHARLIDSALPVVLVCASYSDSLDYKAKKVGASDCISADWVNPRLIQAILPREKPRNKQHGRQNPSGGAVRSMGEASIL